MMAWYRGNLRFLKQGKSHIEYYGASKYSELIDEF
jgi:hypothetical protein